MDRFRQSDNYYVLKSVQPVLDALHSPVIRFVRQFCKVRGDEKILEAGCGSGLYGLALATLGCHCVELDFSEQMLRNVEDAARTLRDAGYQVNVATVRDDLTALALEDDQFDIVFNEGVIEHWVARYDRLAVIREMVRITRPGGRVVVCIPNNSHPLYPWWYFLQRTFRSKQLVFRPGGPLEEAVIGPRELADELREVGLVNVVTDGFAVTRTLAHYPRWWPLRALSKGLEILLPPFPPAVRRRWGVYLLAGGVKRHSS